MHTDKGYIVPVILVVILLSVAGIFIFTQKAESPVSEQAPIATTTQQQELPVATTTDEVMEDDNIENYSFVCSDKTEGTAAFDTANDAAVIVVDGKMHELRVGISASGVRYVNEEETYVFWNKGESAFIEENGKTVHDACVLKSV